MADIKKTLLEQFILGNVLSQNPLFQSTNQKTTTTTPKTTYLSNLYDSYYQDEPNYYLSKRVASTPAEKAIDSVLGSMKEFMTNYQDLIYYKQAPKIENEMKKLFAQQETNVTYEDVDKLFNEDEYKINVGGVDYWKDPTTGEIKQKEVEYTGKEGEEGKDYVTIEGTKYEVEKDQEGNVKLDSEGKPIIKKRHITFQEEAPKHYIEKDGKRYEIDEEGNIVKEKVRKGESILDVKTKTENVIYTDSKGEEGKDYITINGVKYALKKDSKGNVVKDAEGKPVIETKSTLVGDPVLKEMVEKGAYKIEVRNGKEYIVPNVESKSWAEKFYSNLSALMQNPYTASKANLYFTQYQEMKPEWDLMQLTYIDPETGETRTNIIRYDKKTADDLSNIVSSVKVKDPDLQLVGWEQGDRIDDETVKARPVFTKNIGGKPVTVYGDWIRTNKDKLKEVQTYRGGSSGFNFPTPKKIEFAVAEDAAWDLAKKLHNTAVKNGLNPNSEGYWYFMNDQLNSQLFRQELFMTAVPPDWYQGFLNAMRSYFVGYGTNPVEQKYIGNNFDKHFRLNQNKVNEGLKRAKQTQK